MKKLLALALTALALAACQDAPAGHSVQAIHFGSKPPVRLNVAQITITETYRAPLAAPNVDHTLPTPPIMAIKQWAGQRLVAGGAQGSLEVNIEDASVKESKLPLKDGVKGFFTDEQEARFDGHIRISLRLYDGVNTISVAQGDVDVTRFRTINEKATVAQREEALNGMVQEMILQMDSEAEMRLRQYFGRFIIG